MVASLLPSSAAVVEAFGFAALRGRFAVVVLEISPAPGFSVAERVAAACPRFASLLCGWLGCSWWVAWGVAVRCASSFGVSVASGGVASGGAQLSLF